MTCGYNTQTVLELLSDMETDNGIYSDSIYGDSNSVSNSGAYEFRNFALPFNL